MAPHARRASHRASACSAAAPRAPPGAGGGAPPDRELLRPGVGGRRGSGAAGVRRAGRGVGLAAGAVGGGPLRPETVTREGRVQAAPLLKKAKERQQVARKLEFGNGRAVEERAMRKCMERAAEEAAGTRVKNFPTSVDPASLAGAYERCGVVTGFYAKTFYMGTQLMTKEQAEAIWAVYVWCRRTDELVDGPNASHITPEALDRWDERLEDIFNGKPYDLLDAALSDSVAKYALDIQPFRDIVDGMRMDLVKTRYETYEELYEYCYRVAGTVGLMSTPVMGIAADYAGDPEDVYRGALALGVANQLTNILRDVGEDTDRNRIYIPLDELAEYGITEEEVMNASLRRDDGTMDPRWVKFMQFQIARARDVFREAEEAVTYLSPEARWPVWSALILYRQILDSIEANGYDNFSQRAYVEKWKKLASLPSALVRAVNSPGYFGN